MQNRILLFHTFSQFVKKLFNRIVASGMQRMAFTYPHYGIPTSLNYTVLHNGLIRIFRACGIKAAAWWLVRRNIFLISFY